MKNNDDNDHEDNKGSNTAMTFGQSWAIVLRWMYISFAVIYFA